MDMIMERPVTASAGTEKYKVTIEWRNGQIIADEPVAIGGRDTGPDPYTLLLASLASCTLSTLRMYIDRKGWDIPAMTVSLNMYQESSNGLTTTITRDIQFGNNPTAEQIERLLVIAKKCPISKILENNIIIQTTG
jgi:putative redox protein